MTAYEVDGPFPNSIEKGNKTFWYHKTYRARKELERDAKSFQQRGYSTYVITKVHVDALYTYPQTRWGMN